MFYTKTKDMLEILTNSYLVNNDIRNAYLLQIKNIKDFNKNINKITKLYPKLQISNNYTKYQGPIISKNNYNNKQISDKKMGEILEYPCLKDWDKIKGNTKHTIYKLVAVLNNNIEILLIVNKCLDNHKDKFKQLKKNYRQSLNHNQYSNIIYNTCNIKIKTVNVKIHIEEISSLDNIIYKSICNIRLNKANKNRLLKWGIHNQKYTQKDAIKLLNLNELFIRSYIKKRLIDTIPLINKTSILKILQNKKQKTKIFRSINFIMILQQIFI